MGTRTVADICRLTVAHGADRVALAVPADVRLMALLPRILELLDAGLADAGLGHDGWVLQRVGGRPLDDERTLAELAISDGETLHLRPRTEAMPETAFDDLIDGLATAMAARSDPWRPQATRRALLGFTGAALAIGIPALLAGGPARAGVTAGAIVTGLLLLGAVAASRALADLGLSTLLGAAAVGYAGVTGSLLPGLAGPSAAELGPYRLLCAAATGTAVIVVTLLAVRVAVPALITLLLIGAAATLTGLLAVAWPMPPAAACAVVVLVALLAALSTPLAAFRLAGLRLPNVPTGRDDLDTDIEPLPGKTVQDAAALTDRYQTTLSLATAVVCAAGVTPVVWERGWQPAAFVTAVGVLLLLRARVFSGVRQRLTMLCSGGYTLTAEIGMLIVRTAPGRRAVVGAVAAVIGAALFAALSRRIPGRRILPHWGRAADLAEYAAAIACLPLVLGLTGALHWARGLGG